MYPTRCGDVARVGYNPLSIDATRIVISTVGAKMEPAGPVVKPSERCIGGSRAEVRLVSTRRAA
jgi:hypothetical protein